MKYKQVFTVYIVYIYINVWSCWKARKQEKEFFWSTLAFMELRV